MYQPKPSILEESKKRVLIPMRMGSKLQTIVKIWIAENKKKGAKVRAEIRFNNKYTRANYLLVISVSRMTDRFIQNIWNKQLPSFQLFLTSRHLIENEEQR